ncbi:transketolase [Secundilactobacillus paracollinoides]|uniref:Transketolase n=1 Tax=Secundilactobacillus paracollinoides TaxID=240427 RepID=A0A1B2IXU3_9LACO|nr:transketolase [Secundilactobacillus paracollinoides]ANZ60994.1 transketolase [Secundilactobacillus paracollinoides]ANZ66851.1 transketolase [Secundilactobacillus paracollinoides]
MQNTSLDQRSINALRFLSVDMIEKANSGHPGLPLGVAPMAYTLWTKHLNINPTDQKWVNRDRFVLSAGHGSALLYSLLHLSGFNLSIEDLKQFRQFQSKTPGHPEYGIVDGVEATTGPLGQSLGMAVGMAMAENHLAAQYNQPGFNIMDHYTYVISGDGDLMEGVSHESASLAGHLKLGKLIVLYDDNNISLDGPTSMAFTENVSERFEAYDWQVLHVADGNNMAEINAAIETAKANPNQPTLIDVKTIIGFGSPVAGTNTVHGKPLGEANMAATREALGWHYAPFEVPEDVTDNFKSNVKNRGIDAEADWTNLFDEYTRQFPELAERFLNGFKPVHFDLDLPVSHVGEKESGRNTSQRIIGAISQQLPSFWGGSADLFASNKTNIKTATACEANAPAGQNIWFGVREFGEATAVNGMILHGGIHAFASTFFVFSDYMRAAIRLAAIQQIPATYIFTHDSVAVGEDGPTHEPIEHLMSFRAMPNVNVIRPADTNETTAAWRVALAASNTPTILVLSRQDLPTLPLTETLADEGVKHGGYVLSPSKGDVPEGILIATGSEVHVAVAAQTQLREQGHDVSVVSMPSFELFDAQSAEYKESVLPSAVTKRVSIELGTTMGWEHYIGLNGIALGINNRFGESGNPQTIIDSFGITPENTATAFLSLISEKQSVREGQ